jgi:tetratricopeptide (TPR) repeat protein
MNPETRPVLESLPLDASLRAIQAADLIERFDAPTTAVRADEYSFKHTLIQDAAYTSLMHHDRRRLHRLVGEALERTGGERSELAPLLAQHFREAGETTRALPYLILAGNAAAARYANREALAFYSEALEAARDADPSAYSRILRARGQIWELIGEFQPALADLNRALELAQAAHDSQTEWQTLIDLGFSWTARDYTRAGAYFERALDSARAIGDPTLIARSNNRVGNWELNNEEPRRAIEFHHAALEMFETLADRQGVAESNDLLGMAHTIGGDLVKATEHNTRALELAERRGDKAAIAAALISLGLRGPSPETNTMVPAEDSVAVVWQGVARAIPLVQEIGWRAGEAYALWVLGYTLLAKGEYGQALHTARAAFALAHEIQHEQWMVAAQTVLGVIYLQLLSFSAARVQFEQAYARAHKINSLHWIRSCGGFFIMTCAAENDLARAEQLLRETLLPGTPAQTMGERLCYVGRIEVELARGDPDAALVDLEAMLAEVPNLGLARVIPWLWWLRGRAYRQRGEFTRAQLDLEAALPIAQLHTNAWQEGQIRMELIRCLRAVGRNSEAAAHAAEVRRVRDLVAASLDDPATRTTFVTNLDLFLAQACESSAGSKE